MFISCEDFALAPALNRYVALVMMAAQKERYQPALFVAL